MKWYKVLLIIFASALLLVVLLTAGVNFWIKKQLPEIINNNNDSPYHIVYKDLTLSIFDRHIIAENIILVPKISVNNPKTKKGLYARVGSVEVNDFKIWDLLFSDKIVAKNVIIRKPDVTLFKGNENSVEKSDSLQSNVVAPFKKIIYVSDVYLRDGSMKIVTLSNKPVMSARNISFQMEGIMVTDKTLEKTVPVNFMKYAVKCTDVYYRINQFYNVSADSVSTTNNYFVAHDIKLVPQYSRAAFLRTIPKEKDLFSATVAKIELNNLSWGFKNDEFYSHSNSLILNKVNANVYRGKMPPDDMTKKKLYSSLLREIPYDIAVDTLKVSNSRIVYEEEKDAERGAGKISFGRFNLSAMGISTGYKKSKVPDVRIFVNCRLMDVAPVKLSWRFNVLDRSDGFTIKGKVFNIPAESLDAFTKPYMNVKVEGDLDEIYFTFTGNDNGAKGDLGINYDDLKVRIYRKNNPKKKNKLLTAIANLFVKNSTKEKVKNASIDVKRIPEKSFYNLLWRSIAEGLKKILV